MFAIRFVSNNELIGCCGLCYINWIHRNADLSLYIGLNEVYIDNEGYAEEACRLLLNFSFNEMGLVKVWTEIYEFDSKKLELYKALGFLQDGLLRKQYFFGGKWWDSRIMSVLSVDYKACNHSTFVCDLDDFIEHKISIF
jgi:RimJ/RimL family protein N-acetyltransferase